MSNHTQTDPNISRHILVERAKAVLAANDLGISTKPAPIQYPHQWNWDSAFIAIGFSHYDTERAKTEILSLLSGQWKNGMIPHIIYSSDTSGYFPDSQRWLSDSIQSEIPTGKLTSGISQPPLITIAVKEVAGHADLKFLRQVYPCLLAYHRWFHTARDPSNEGLVSIIHPWESGMENSPRWCEVLENLKISERPVYKRKDQIHVNLSQRPSDYEYDRYVYLMDLIRDMNYEHEQILEKSPFVVQDVLLNSILYHADECLYEIAQKLGESVEEIEGWMTSTRIAFDQRFWNANDALYYDYDVRNKRQIRQNTIATFMPIYAGLVDDRKVLQLVKNHLVNPNDYAPLPSKGGYYIPTVSKSNPYFDRTRYWRGPVWVNTNWLVMRGLERYGYSTLANQIRADTKKLVESQGFFEYFDPVTGQGYGTNQFSWSASLLIDLIETSGT